MYCIGLELNRRSKILLLYKEVILPRKFYADFVLFDNMVLENV
jgi:hypothetical protein